VKNVEICRKCR